MILLREEDFLIFASKSVLDALKKTVLTNIQKAGAKKGFFGEGVTKYTFDGKADILIIFYKYKMVDDNDYKANYEVYHGYEEDDFILDKINELKERVESRGQVFVWS